MRCQIAKLTMLFTILSLSSCKTAPTDSFCSVYTPVVREKGDGVITAKAGPKRRILANELLYVAECRK
jgi:hypothetical protein